MFSQNIANKKGIMINIILFFYKPILISYQAIETTNNNLNQNLMKLTWNFKLDRMDNIKIQEDPVMALDRVTMGFTFIILLYTFASIHMCNTCYKSILEFNS